jgi:hypothetical protein
LSGVFEPDLAPFIVLMAIGFVVGVAGHIYQSRTAVAAGIGMIFVATIVTGRATPSRWCSTAARRT